jgi:hypothetical protein
MSTVVRVATMVASAVAGPDGWRSVCAVGSSGRTTEPRTAAAHANSLGCGYDGQVNGSATYNHCGRGSVVIEVDHFFW